MLGNDQKFGSARVQPNSDLCQKLLCLLFVRKFGRTSAEPKVRSITTLVIEHHFSYHLSPSQIFSVQNKIVIVNFMYETATNNLTWFTEQIIRLEYFQSIFYIFVSNVTIKFRIFSVMVIGLHFITIRIFFVMPDTRCVASYLSHCYWRMFFRPRFDVFCNWFIQI